jgi:hypothetical protein
MFSRKTIAIDRTSTDLTSMFQAYLVLELRLRAPDVGNLLNRRLVINRDAILLDWDREYKFFVGRVNGGFY